MSWSLEIHVGSGRRGYHVRSSRQDEPGRGRNPLGEGGVEDRRAQITLVAIMRVLGGRLECVCVVLS